MDNKIKLLADSIGPEKFKFDERVAPYTALGVGGPAKLFFVAFNTSEILSVIQTARQLKIPYFIFGTGSKHMISEKGFDGVVIKNRTQNIAIIGVKGRVSRDGIGVDEALVEVESGVSMNALVEFLSNHNLESSYFANLPGSVGGNIFINKALQDKTKSIKILNDDSEEEEIQSVHLNLRVHIILSCVLKVKAK